MMKVYLILRKYGLPLEEIARVININLGQVMFLAKEASERDIEQDRSTP